MLLSETLLSHFQALAENKSDLFRTLMDIQNTITHSVFGLFQSQAFQSSAAETSEKAQREKKERETKSRWIAEMIEHPVAAANSSSASDAAERGDEEAPLLASTSSRDRSSSQKAEDQPALSQLSSEHLALVVDGDSLIKIFGDETTERLFLSLAMLCRRLVSVPVCWLVGGPLLFFWC